MTPSARPWLVLLGVFGAALLYGDGVITPAISVLSAVAGLKLAAPVLQPYAIRFFGLPVAQVFESGTSVEV